MQGYVVLKKKSRLSALKKLLPRAHWEIREGTHDQARAYCMKEETRTKEPYEWGDPPAQGKRNDMAAMVEVRLLSILVVSTSGRVYVQCSVTCIC